MSVAIANPFTAAASLECGHTQVTGATVYVGARYGGWQEAALRYLATRYNASARSFPADTTGAVCCLFQEGCDLQIMTTHQSLYIYIYMYIGFRTRMLEACVRAAGQGGMQEIGTLCLRVTLERILIWVRPLNPEHSCSCWRRCARAARRASCRTRR